MQVRSDLRQLRQGVGDFGVGWHVDLANFRVTVNKPLGLRRLGPRDRGCGLIFCPTHYTSSTPHFATVVWPDGHQEIFDFAPRNGSTFFSLLTAAAFRGRPGHDLDARSRGRRLAGLARRRQPVRRLLRIGTGLRRAAFPPDREGRHGLHPRPVERARLRDGPERQQPDGQSGRRRVVARSIDHVDPRPTGPDHEDGRARPTRRSCTRIRRAATLRASPTS